MSERILKALMQMFAIIARVDGINDNGRLIVQSFLKQQLNQELVDQYLKIFDEFCYILMAKLVVKVTNHWMRSHYKRKVSR